MSTFSATRAYRGKLPVRYTSRKATISSGKYDGETCGECRASRSGGDILPREHAWSPFQEEGLWRSEAGTRGRLPELFMLNVTYDQRKTGRSEARGLKNVSRAVRGSGHRYMA